jgi:hypothetical protein
MAYYQRDWFGVLTASLGLVREAFALHALQAWQGAWWVLRANQVWAPYPRNDPDCARAYMARFYSIALKQASHPFAPEEAARLEVGWWQAHRDLQHGRGAALDGLTDAIAQLYAYVYGVEVATVCASARLRAEAMHVCDRWVDGGREAASPLIVEMSGRLLHSYRLLRAAAG